MKWGREDPVGEVKKIMDGKRRYKLAQRLFFFSFFFSSKVTAN